MYFCKDKAVSAAMVFDGVGVSPGVKICAVLTLARRQCGRLGITRKVLNAVDKYYERCPDAPFRWCKALCFAFQA